MTSTRTRGAAVGLAAAALIPLFAAAPAAAQEFRFGGATVAQVIDLPTLVLDSVPVGATTGSGMYRQTADGYVAWCPPGSAYCLYHKSGPVIQTAPVTQDLELTSWGFGEGLRFYGQVRFRATGEDQAWPFAQQTVSAIAVYLEWDKPDFRARLGRQFTQNGLGYYNYDGLSVLWRAKPWLDAEIYGGGSPMEAVNAPYTNTVITDNTSPVAPNNNAWLIGTRVRGRWANGASLSAIFQIIDRDDFGALYAEQMAVNGFFRAGRTSINGDIQYDFATGNFNLAQLKWQVPVTRVAGFFVEGRHYQPFFQLWSIWAVFSPVAYNEGNLGGYWNSAHGALGLQVTGGWRNYDNADAGVSELRTSGWRVGADATWHPDALWTVRGGYHYDIGPGAAESDGNVSVRWDPNASTYAGLFATAFQTAYEYMQGAGTVVGGGVTGGVRLNSWGRLAADVGEYRNTYSQNAPQSNWNQFRASLRFEFDVGPEPGYAGGGVVR